MSILEYNGGCVVAMAGKQCVAIASDKRFGIQQQTVGTNMRKAFKMHDQLYLGLTGLVTDIETVYEKLKFRVNLYKLNEDRDIKPSAFSNLVSSLLYERRFGPWFTEPVIAGLEGEDHKPIICAQDLIGAPCYTNNFVVSGTCAESLYGMCESLFKPNMEPDELFEVISQCLLAAVDRDALSGWGATVIIITPDKIIEKELKCRMD